ncbi:alpha-2-macroglobulin-like protein [Elysia marginata]|uniref:Alpha-2-macroglobulin-like protein n=1 Tax=Elysia marginata TaxID=1093978 RepID=A0AAV4ID55_9GAST|nr:alpha-2-macroglobulin-like protein [Elysia marginata]
MRETSPDTITSWAANAVCMSENKGFGLSEVTSLTTFQPFFLSIHLPYAAVMSERFPMMVTIYNYLEKCITPPGVEQSYSYSTYLCSKDGNENSEEVPLKLPQGDEIVQGSARGEVQVIGDIMGPAFSNLDHLVRMPTGCGEQNMVGFVPNILVLNYLKSTGTLDEKTQMAAIKNMEAGYQRELNYRHSDGSFSAFGEQEDQPSGSVWLTAFVVKSFSQASKHIFIDERDLAKSVKFLQRSQLENGCFRETGKVFSTYMMGGMSRASKNPEGDQPLAALTAYVLVALLEAGVNASSPSIKSGIKCMNAEFRLNPRRTDPYTVALLSYANMQFNPRGPHARLAFRTLRGKAKKDATTMHWSRGRYQPPMTNSWYYRAAPSAEVEMTSYALMSYLKFYSRRPVQMGSKIAVWLTRQRNAFGGFSSTQDTVVGLDALSQFAALAYVKNPTELTVDVHTSSGVFAIDREFRVSDSEGGTRFLLQSEPFLFSEATQDMSSKLHISTKGVGCALIQTNVRFNKPQKASLNGERPRFFLKIQVKRDFDKCNRRTLEVSVWSKRGHRFNKGMGMVTVRMITSWSPMESSLNNFTRKPKRFSIDVEQDTELAVSSPSPAEVRVFEYYETDVANVQEYNIKTTCGTKEEIPLRPPGPSTGDAPSSFGRIEQTRVSGPRRGCPRCITTSRTIPANFESSVCSAAAVYKGVAGRKGAKSMKLRQDLRPVTQLLALGLFASPDMAPGCNCSLLDTQGKPRRVMIIASKKVSRKELYLDENSIVMLTSMKAENAARAAQKTCPEEQ